MDFPGGPAVKNPSANAGDMNLIPIWGRFHMLQGIWSYGPPLHATTAEPAHLEPELSNERSHCSEKPAHHN